MKRLLPLALLAAMLGGCGPECVDFSDCAAQAEKSGREQTCVNNRCTYGTPFSAARDAGR